MKRKRTNQSERDSAVADFNASGLSRRDYANEHGIKQSTLERWIAKSKVQAPKRKYTKRQKPASPNPEELVLAMQFSRACGSVDRASFVLQHFKSSLEQLIG